MTASEGRKNRDVVPRWRNIKGTIRAGEFPTGEVQRTMSAVELANLAATERLFEATGETAYAADLAGSALAGGLPERGAIAVAALSSEEHGASLSSLVRAVRGEELPEPVGEREVVSRARLWLRERPNDPIAWASLARGHLLARLPDRAIRAMRVAVALGGDNRYILRSATSLLVAVDEPEEALHLLDRSQLKELDPWVLSAHLAVSSHLGKRPRLVKTARRIADSTDFPSIAVAELLSELGTIEFRAGKDRHARRLLERSLTASTENSLAQVQWASSRVSGLTVPDQHLEVPLANEARAIRAIEAAEWAGAVEECDQWLGDQPFSLGAALLGSHAAATGLGDAEKTEWFASQGLVLQKDEPTLLNNLAFALLEQGRTDEAERVLAVAVPDEVSAVALTATHGLLEIKKGDLEGGRRLYQQAIRMARQKGERAQQAIATAMLARAEEQGESGAGLALFQEAVKLAQGQKQSSGVHELLDRMVWIGE